MSVAFTMPGSYAIPTNRSDSIVWARHRLLGGTLARAWGSYEVDGTTYAWTVRHGSGCDPTLDVDALAGAELATVVLTPGADYTSQDVADAIAAELLSAFGHDATVDSTTVDGQTRYVVTVAGATAGAVGGADAGPSGASGITQGRRDGAGAVNGTLWVHTEVHARRRDGSEVSDGTPCRIVGVGYYGTGSFRGRCCVGLGGAYADPPGSITGIQDAGRDASGSSNGYEPIVLPLATAIPTTIGADAWIGVCDGNTGGALGYRFQGAGLHGDLGATENLLVEGSRNDPTAAFPSSVNPTITANFGVHSQVFLIVEVDDQGDGSGFKGDGSIAIEYGCQRSAAGETPSSAVPNGSGTGETFHFRFRTPPIPRVAIAEVAFAMAVVDADEDATFAVYRWPDLTNPPGSAPVLVGDAGMLGLDAATANAYTVTPITPIAIGDDVVSDPYVSIGFGFGVIAGGIATGCEILFDAREATFGIDGERVYDQGASPDLQPSDFVVGGLRDQADFVSLPTSTMPYDGPNQAWPSTYDLAGADTIPGNLARTYVVVRNASATADVVTVETIAESTSAVLDAVADIAVSARAFTPIEPDPLEVSIALAVSASLVLTTSWSARMGLDLVLPRGLDETPPEIGETDMSIASLVLPPGVSPSSLPVSAASGTSAVRIGPAATSTSRVVAVGGFIRFDADATITLYNGDPGGFGVAITSALPVLEGEKLYLGPWLRSGQGSTLYVARATAVGLAGVIDYVQA